MKPVDQTILHDEMAFRSGDCYRACVASILEIPVEEVPHFAELYQDNMYNEAEKWFASRGVYSIRLFIKDFSQNRIFLWGMGAHAIVSGLSPRGKNVHHSIVGHADGYNVTMVHDPHPDRTGIVGGDRWIQILYKDGVGL